MFIVHGAWLRKHMRWFLGGLLIVLIPGFIALFTTTGGPEQNGRGQPTIHGKPINPAELQACRNSVIVEYLLANGGQLPRDRQTDQTITRQAVINLLALRQAREFGIQATDDEVRAQTERQRVFQNEQGQFDYYRYTAILGRLNLKPLNYEETVRQQIVLTQLQNLIGAAAKVTPLQVQQEYLAWNERVTIDYVPFDAAQYPEPITITDAEAKAYFDKHTESYRTSRQVKVRYAFVPVDTNGVTVSDTDIAAFYNHNQAQFTNTLAQATAEIREDLVRSRSLRRAGDRATELSVKLVAEPGQPQPDFAKVAAGYGVTVGETDFFGAQDTPAGIKAGTAFNQAVFNLSKDSPCSDPVEGTGGYYVLELVATKPSTIPPFEQVKAQVVAKLKQERAYEATGKRGSDLREQVVKLMGTGKSFTAACAELKLTPRQAEPFTLSATVTNLPAATALKEAVLSMRVNAVSEFIPDTAGGLFFHLIARQPPAAAMTADDEAKYRQRLLRQQQEVLWQSWLGNVWRQEQVDLGFPALPATPPPAADS